MTSNNPKDWGDGKMKSAYEMLDVMISQHMRKHPSEHSDSIIEMWKLREQAKIVAEETVLMDIVYQYH